MVEMQSDDRNIAAKQGFASLLFAEGESVTDFGTYENTDTAYDLNLEQIFASILTGFEEYDLRDYFLRPLTTQPESIRYRQQVMHDTQQEPIGACLHEFAAQMRDMRATLTLRSTIRHELQQQIRLLEAACVYIAALRQLHQALSLCQPMSKGLRGFLNDAQNYLASTTFLDFERQTLAVRQALAAVRYSLDIDGRRVKVSDYEEHPDFGADIQQTFAKFQETEGKRYKFEFHGYPEMNHVEAEILDRVARLNASPFDALREFATRHSDFVDETLARFDREIHFYLSYVAFMRRISAAGHSFCCPEITTEGKDIFALQATNVALADQQIAERKTTVPNSFELSGAERILVVSGPNQGGKTTFARMFGQLHYLAALGCYVPARKARLYLFDRLYTHFEREEKVQNLAGKLEEDLMRMHQILENATGRSILVMNESLLATTLEDALFLSQQVLNKVIANDMLCLTVTFLDELSTFSPQTVSMVSELVDESTSERSFKIVRRPADGRAYALAVAEKYGLSYEALERRIEA